MVLFILLLTWFEIRKKVMACSVVTFCSDYELISTVHVTCRRSTASIPSLSKSSCLLYLGNNAQ